MSKVFRRRNALAVHELHYGPNMTPMVDVVMVILIFFMSSTAILGPEWFLKSSLPTTKAARASDDEPPRRVQIRLRATPAGARVDLDERADLTIDALATALREMSRERGAEKLVVLIAPDPNAGYEDVVRVHELCERLGLKRVGLFDAVAPAERNK